MIYALCRGDTKCEKYGNFFRLKSSECLILFRLPLWQVACINPRGNYYEGLENLNRITDG
jgi:hypothetical protein